MKIKFYKTNKMYYAVCASKSNEPIEYKACFIITPRTDKVRYISNKTKKPVLYKSDGVTLAPYIANKAKEIDNWEVPSHIKKSLTYYLTVADGRRIKLDGSAMLGIM